MSKGPNLNDAEDWLHVFDECSSQVQKMLEAITKRNQKLEQDSKSGVSASADNNIVELNAKLKRDMRLLGRDLQDLNSSLSTLTGEISGREIQRRRDQLNELIQRKDELQKLLNKKPGNSTRANKLTGGSGRRKNDPEVEPDSIKGMEQEQVLAYQNKVMQDQDKGLDALSDALTRTKHIGLAISDELDEHQVLLGDLDRSVERTDVKLRKETRRIDKLLRSSKTPIAFCLIFVLFCIVVALIVIILKFSNVF